MIVFTTLSSDCPLTIAFWRFDQVFKTTRLNEVTVAAAKNFVRRMKAKTKPLAENTARRVTGFARQFFNDAVERKLIGKNPFLARDIKVSIRGNAERFHLVHRDDAVKVLEDRPDAQWRLIFALSRFGRLRCPGEHLALRWGDVDWLHNRIRVPSPKTEHHEGKGERMLPLFPDRGPTWKPDSTKRPREPSSSSPGIGTRLRTSGLSSISSCAELA